MFQLTKNIHELLEKDTPTRLRVALGMGVQEVSVKRALARKSNSIANNIGAVEALMDITGLPKDQIIQPINQPA